ncbi:MAG: hypothetical protein LUC86_04885 [Prevotellaceae bacterium]|nr:hypothetical protein [Prevotellaceae bacterium]
MLSGFIHSCAELIDYIDEVGFLPLLSMGVRGWSAEQVVGEECRYSPLPDGGFEWPLWEWKGEIIRESGCAYGKFFDKKAAFVSREWWADFCNLRRSVFPAPREGSIEESILYCLSERGSLTTRELRRACGFTGARMRSRFDGYVASLEMGCRVVTEDFVYPEDRHGRRYGWGWSLLTTPERLFGSAQCHTERKPEESRQRILRQLQRILPDTPEEQIARLVR